MTVALDVPAPGASIAWTLDGGDDVHWRLYGEPIVVAASATLRARAVRYGWAESDEIRACFVIASAPPACP
ncbi:MAG: chitobiase/beta-hexosaminidase C-terminal domain-containing protein [Thermodesulfobacteriota bacterium]